MAGLRDYNPQKERLLQTWLTLAATSKNLPKHAEIMDKLEGNDAAFGAAIEKVYQPWDSQHEHPVGMVTLAAAAFHWVEGKGSKPEWLTHAGIE